jgi:hypothetical protein
MSVMADDKGMPFNFAQNANKGLAPLNSGTTAANNGTDISNAYIYNDASVIPMWSKDGRPTLSTDVTAAKGSYFLQPQPVKDVYINIMNKNYGVGKWTPAQLNSLFVDSIENTRIGFAMTGDTYTPDVYAAEIARTNAANGLDAGGKALSGGSGGVSSSVQKSVRLTDPSTARGLIDQALGNFLGRAADPQEQKAFLKALNVQERQNPTVTRQTTVSGGGSSSSTSSTVGGFNPSTFAKEYAAGQEGAGEFQAATSLLDTFISSLGAKV